MTKKFLADCKVKHLTLGEMPEALKRIEKSLEQAKNNKKDNRSKYKKPQTNGSTASIKPIEIEAHEEDPVKFFTAFDHEKQTKHNTFGCQNVQASTLPVLTEDNLPKWEELEKTAYKNNKTCVVCGKPKMKNE